MNTDPAALKHWLALVRAPGVGAAYAGRLLERFGNPEAALRARPSTWKAAGIPESLYAGLKNPDWDGVEQDLKWLTGERRCLVTLNDPDYPERLREISHVPPALFCQGNPALLSSPQLAVVGARSATPQGLEIAAGLAAELTRCGLLITSGLALGIDGAAHRGALSAGGATVAVCATGLDRVYPARHRELAHEIAGKGLLISEFPTGTPPLAEHFPRRNRLISGLSLGVLVVEAAPQSGSLITARLALEQGREVFAVPGSIHSPQSRGCHALIRQGAKLTESVRDILEELGPRVGMDRVPADGVPSSAASDLDPVQQRVLEAFGFGATTFDTLVERLSLSVEALSSALLALELQGRVTLMPGGAYVRVQHE
ncbi:MAG: DNA-processing protein DprA [Nevskiales bacterium]|nr:DNA-processing protein DprA [Nevskiales bacterium]